MNEKENKFPWYSEEAGFFSEWYFGIVGIQPKDAKAPMESNFLEKALRLKKGSKILDLCCGHGRITNELAQRGYDMTGQDINQFFLDTAQKRANELNLNINLIKSDMRDIPFKDTFDAAINMFTSFGYLGSDTEDEKVFKSVHKSLKPKGKFLIDYVNKDFIIKYYRTEEMRDIDNGYVKITREYDFLKSSHIDTYDVFIDGKFVKQFISDFRFYSVTELIAMLLRNGFRILNIYGGFNFEPLSFDTKNCIILAEKI